MDLLGVRICDVKGCNEVHWAKGWCNTHYQRLKRLGSSELPVKADLCSNEDCGGIRTRAGLCRNCSERKYYATRPKRVRT